MAIKLGGSDGGANIPYKGSTAEVTYQPVAQGSYQHLDSEGNIVPSTGIIADTAAVSQSSIGIANGFAGRRTIDVYYGGRAENTMPNGNSLLVSVAYDNGTASAWALTLVDSEGVPLTYYKPYTPNSLVNYNGWSTQYLGEDSQYYLFSVFLTGYYQNGYQYSIIVKVAKSDNAITSNQVTGYAHSSNNQAQMTQRSAPRLYLARDKSVYCQEYMSAYSSSTSQTITIATGTVNSSYSTSLQQNSTFTVYKPTNVSLTKYDDGSGNFLLMYATGTGSLVFKKISVAANGSHTVTDVTPTGLSLGTNDASQLRPDRSSLLESEVAGKYIFVFVPEVWQANYQKLSYDGTTVTASGFQKYEVGNTQSVNYFFSYTGSALLNLYSSGQWIYRYAEDKMYLFPAATHVNWASNTEGAVWTLGTGNVVNTAVKTNLFSDFSSSVSRLISIAENNIVSSITGWNASTETFLKASTSQLFSALASTKEKVAYVRQAGDVGDTVNISLIEGITSSDTLSLTYFLNKEDFYYPLSSISSSTNDSVIKSIQRGNNTFTTDGEITIAAVDISKSFINYHAWSNSTYNPNHGQLSLINSTTLSFNVFAGTNYVQWEVIEYV
jgi:hypothetical protein